MKENSLLVYNSNILSMDKSDSVFNWMSIINGKITELGFGDGYKSHLVFCDDAVDMKCKTILPGFYDSHVHLVQTGLNYEGLDFKPAGSIDDVLTMIEERASNLPDGKLLRGIHFDVTSIKEARFPTRRELDMVCPNNPVWINSIEYHTSILNSLALNIINIPLFIDGIARDERNLPLGYFTSKASAFIRNKMFGIIDDKTRKSGINKAIIKAISKGVTSINAMEGGFTFHEKDVAFLLKHMKSFPIDTEIYYQSFSFEKIAEYGLNRIGDIFVDGAFGSRTAAISENYKDDKDNKGKLYYSQEELNYFVKKANRLNYQIALHAIGGRAIEQTLNAFDCALKEYPRKDHRSRMEHFELASTEHIKKAKELDMVISVQPAYEYKWGTSNSLYEDRLGKELASKTNNFKEMIDCGLILCGGSDSDVTEINPLLGIHCAVNHPKPNHSVSVKDALKMFTINGAFACFEEKIKGSLETGKFADFVVLNDDPVKIDKKYIKDIEVLETYKEGTRIFPIDD